MQEQEQEVGMLKQSAGSRKQRYKEFKVKHVLQICALLALCIWLLNQARSTSDNKVPNENGVVKLGRKELNPRLHIGVEDENMEGERAETDEEMEDLIDEEDREQENQIEDLSLMAINMNEGDESLQRKGEDASTALVKNNFGTSQTAAQMEEKLKNDGQTISILKVL